MTQEEVLPPSHRLEACCRLCLSGDEPRSTSLFLFPVPPGHPAGPEDHSPPSPSSVTEQRLLIEMILECTSIQITLEEDYPAKVCEKCVETLDKFYQYRRRCLANDQILRLERLRTGGQRKPPNNNNNNEEEKEEEEEEEEEHRGTGTASAPPPPALLMHRPSPPTSESSHQPPPLHATATPPPVMAVPAIRIKSEPRGEGAQEEEQQHPAAVETDPQPAALCTDGGGMSSILRSILLQTRDSTTSRSSPNTEPESPRQTPQLLPHPVPPADDNQQQAEEHEDEEQDIKPSLLQQMLLQQQRVSSPANRSPAKAASDTNEGGGALSGNNSTGSCTSASTSSLLKRMLLDGSGTAGSAPAEQQAPPPPPTSVSPLEGPSGQPPHRSTPTHHLRTTKHEPPSATNTPSPPGQRAKDDVPTNETPLASQLRSILLQHRAPPDWEGTTTRTASMSDASPEQHPPSAQERSTNATSAGEKPEVSYVRSLFLRNDSDSESEPPPVEDQREMLLYAMFHELRTRQQQQQQQPQLQHQQQAGFSSDSDDDSDDLPQDYRLPSVRRRSTDSVESRPKRRRMEYPCLLCGRSFAGKTRLVLHMRTHMMLEGGGADGSTLSGGGGAATISLPAVSPAAIVAAGGGVLLPNGSGGGASDVEDIAGRLLSAQQQHHHHHRQEDTGGFGESSVGNEDEIDALERRSYACYICGADQNNLAQLKEHLLAAHQDRIRSRGRTRERQKASIACEICQRSFRSQFAYGEHMRTHTGERPFPCDQCDKRFPRRFQLLGHLYNVHKQSWVADESKAKFAKK